LPKWKKNLILVSIDTMMLDNLKDTYIYVSVKERSGIENG